jgi:hypothetical protein
MLSNTFMSTKNLDFHSPALSFVFDNPVIGPGGCFFCSNLSIDECLLCGQYICNKHIGGDEDAVLCARCSQEIKTLKERQINEKH